MPNQTELLKEIIKELKIIKESIKSNYCNKHKFEFDQVTMHGTVIYKCQICGELFIIKE